MNKQFILIVEYGTGRATMLTETPDLLEAIQEFLKEYGKALPNTKMCGLPEIKKAEILPLLYRSEGLCLQELESSADL